MLPQNKRPHIWDVTHGQCICTEMHPHSTIVQVLPNPHLQHCPGTTSDGHTQKWLKPF